jgi:hypothetical protein
MKKLNLIITGFALLGLLAFSNCASNDDATEEGKDSTIVQLEKKMDNIESTDSTKSKTKEGASKLGKEYTAKYICPDHCKGSGSDKAGKCSVCAMDLIENPNYQK